MAARRSKSQARRNGGGSDGLPGWAWMIIGVVLALGVVLAAGGFPNDTARRAALFPRTPTGCRLPTTPLWSRPTADVSWWCPGIPPPSR